MKIKEFVELYKGTKNKEEFIKSHIVKDYVSFEDKVNLCATTIASTYFQIDSNTKKARLHISSTATYIKFTMKMIDAYTDLDVDYTSLVSEYDELNKEDLVGMIIYFIPERECKELDKVLEMTKSDIIQNNANPATYIANTVKDFGEALGADLVPILESLVDVLNDETKMKKIVKTVEGSKVFKLLK